MAVLGFPSHEAV